MAGGLRGLGASWGVVGCVGGLGAGGGSQAPARATIRGTKTLRARAPAAVDEIGRKPLTSVIAVVDLRGGNPGRAPSIAACRAASTGSCPAKGVVVSKSVKIIIAKE